MHIAGLTAPGYYSPLSIGERRKVGQRELAPCLISVSQLCFAGLRESQPSGYLNLVTSNCCHVAGSMVQVFNFLKSFGKGQPSTHF